MLTERHQYTRNSRKHATPYTWTTEKWNPQNEETECDTYRLRKTPSQHQPPWQKKTNRPVKIWKPLRIRNSNANNKNGQNTKRNSKSWWTSKEKWKKLNIITEVKKKLWGTKGRRNSNENELRPWPACVRSQIHPHLVWGVIWFQVTTLQPHPQHLTTTLTYISKRTVFIIPVVLSHLLCIYVLL